MSKKRAAAWLTDEVADFFSGCPSREEMLAYRPSPPIQARHNALLAKSKKGSLNADEEWELSQFEHLQILIQSIKARLRTCASVPS